ncbi:hypothetical protein RJ640_026006 [Escallonia rubra]|uniref:Zinc finger, CCHC-type n=1 Tax=Escallonia rubra TaxID=112253 RepID=A0AA88S4W0_9ASTE|nr:hypothetical protein RJ640_026006 [Escallonia rubra]
MKYACKQFDGKTNFGIWQSTMKDILMQQGLLKPLLGNKPESMDQDDCEEIQAKAEEGETTGGDKGSEGGGMDLNLGTPEPVLSAIRSTSDPRPTAAVAVVGASPKVRRSENEVVMNDLEKEKGDEAKFAEVSKLLEEVITERNRHFYCIVKLALLVHHEPLDGGAELEELGELVVGAGHVDAGAGAEDEMGWLNLCYGAYDILHPIPDDNIWSEDGAMKGLALHNLEDCWVGQGSRVERRLVSLNLVLSVKQVAQSDAQTVERLVTTKEHVKEHLTKAKKTNVGSASQINLKSNTFVSLVAQGGANVDVDALLYSWES